MPFKAWVRSNGGDWNDDPSADPAAGTGAVDLSALAGNALFPTVHQDGGCSQTCNFGATPFAYTVPSGFTAGWPASGGGYTTLDPASLAGPGLPVLSNGNLTFSGSLSDCGAQALDGYSVGKYYFELTLTSHGGLMFRAGGGIARRQPVLQYYWWMAAGTSIAGGANSTNANGGVGLFLAGFSKTTGRVAALQTNITADDLPYATGDVISFAIDLGGIIAPDYAITLDEDTSRTDVVVATGADGITYSVVSGPSHGTLTLNADGTYVYDAARGYFGADSFTYRATDPASGIYDDGTVSITVNQAFPLTGVVKVLLPPAELQFCDADGKPYAGGTLEFYEPGTSNPKDTWSSPTGDSDTLNTNPLTLDSAGRALIYGDGAYRTVLRDADGTLIWDQPSFTYVSAAMMPVVGAADLATAREAMGITEAIEAEATARAAADSAEATARAAEDVVLAAAIAAETARAEAAEAALGARIDGLPPPASPGTVQGGEARLDASGYCHVTFGTPFATACDSVAITGAAVGVWSGAFNIANQTTTGVDVWGSIFGSRTPAAGVAFFYMATGH